MDFCRWIIALNRPDLFPSSCYCLSRKSAQWRCVNWLQFCCFCLMLVVVVVVVVCLLLFVVVCCCLLFVVIAVAAVIAVVVCCLLLSVIVCCCFAMIQNFTLCPDNAKPTIKHKHSIVNFKFALYTAHQPLQQRCSLILAHSSEPPFFLETIWTS